MLQRGTMGGDHGWSGGFTEFEGFTGNEGATKETLYRCAIVVFWPVLQEMDLIR